LEDFQAAADILYAECRFSSDDEYLYMPAGHGALDVRAMPSRSGIKKAPDGRNTFRGDDVRA
jgi:hypothetical protein